MKVKIIERFRKEYDGKKTIYIGDLIKDKVYNVLSITKHGFYQIVDESGEDYIYPPDIFEIIEQ